jgi:hypothetical protein
VVGERTRERHLLMLQDSDARTALHMATAMAMRGVEMVSVCLKMIELGGAPLLMVLEAGEQGRVGG